MLTFLLWLSPLILAWSLAVFAVLYPIVRIVALLPTGGPIDEGGFDLLRAAISFPARALRGRGAIT
jgi:hypothetical protein